MLKIGHSVTRPGLKIGDPPLTINVPEELETVPGIVQNPHEVDFYSREYPLETQNIEKSADGMWALTVYTKEAMAERRIHDDLNRPIVLDAKISGNLEPTVKPAPGKDVTQEIKDKARELGFSEVGISRYDLRYVYKSKRSWVKYQHAVCLAYEQEYGPTQSAPSLEAEGPHYGTYRLMGVAGVDLAAYIRDNLGYHAQVHHPNDNSGPYIPMLVEAGLGQVGANGQLLSPHFGSRARLMIVTTDAPVTYDKPIDYGMHAFCNICQVCVNRCPGRALIREKVWYRGTQRHKLIYRRCRPVLSRYFGCAVCMKVCPIQRYGMKPVLDHYTATGQVLGKGTHLLEGYSMRDMGYFGPSELPSFDKNFFTSMPNGNAEDLVFEDLKDKFRAGEVTDGPEGDQILQEFRLKIKKLVSGPKDYLGRTQVVEDA